MILIWVIRFKNNLAELCHFFMKTSNSKIRKDNEKSWTNQKNWPWQAPWQIIFERFCLSPHIIVLNILVANSFDRKSTKYTLKSRQFSQWPPPLLTTPHMLCCVAAETAHNTSHKADLLWTLNLPRGFSPNQPWFPRNPNQNEWQSLSSQVTSGL